MAAACFLAILLIGDRGDGTGVQDRPLFAPGDPSLSAFHQSAINDCFVLAAIAAAVHLKPAFIRSMIHEDKDGFQVDFFSGKKVHVSAITQTAFHKGAKTGKGHGLWLTVLERAIGEILVRQRYGDKPMDNKGKIVAALDSRGRCGPIIAILTGHETMHRRFGNQCTDGEIAAILTAAAKSKRIVCCSTPKGKRTPGITPSHEYAVLGYSALRRQVQVFNPHGEDFQPKGKPGVENGYSTDHGLFSVPLAEFRQVFVDLDYETDQPAKREDFRQEGKRKG